MSTVTTSISWAPGPAGSSGIFGLIDIITHAATRLGRAIDPTVAHGLSGSAFRHYVLNPADNHAFDTVYPGVRWSASALSIDNYGAIEAVAPLYALDIRRWIRPSPADAAGLLRLELTEGRTIGARVSEAEPWSMVLGFSAGKFVGDDPFARAAATDEPTTATFALTADGVWEGPELLSVRVAQEVPAGRRHAIQRELLAFVHQHAHTGKEIGGHTDFMFASGLRAWALLADLAEAADDDSELTAALELHLDELARARAVSPGLFTAWRDGLDAADPWWADVPGGARAFDRAVLAWRDVADATAEARVAVGTTLLPRAIRRAAEHEARAIEALPRTSGLW
jgi:hypothetical protein